MDHTNVEWFPENHKDTKSLESFQTNHNDLDTRNLRGKSKGRNYVASFNRIFGESFKVILLKSCTLYLVISSNR